MLLKSIRRLPAALGMVALLAAIFAGSAMAEPPEVTTEAATKVTATEATLNATLNTGGYTTLYGFEYVPQGGEGVVPKGQVMPAGQKTPVHVSQTMTGLKPNTTYSFRALAFGNEKLAEGSYLKFKTKKLLGLSVVGKSSEGPATFRALEYPTNLSIKDEKSYPFKILIGKDTLECSETLYYAETMTAALTTVAAFVTPEGCKFGSFGAVEVAPNFCRVGLEAPAGGSEEWGRVGLECEAEKLVFGNPSTGCQIKIPTQAPVSSGWYLNQGEGIGSSVYTMFSRSITYEKKGPLCGLVSGSGTMQGSMTLSAVE
jgi:hypothetical protein